MVSKNQTPVSEKFNLNTHEELDHLPYDSKPSHDFTDNSKCWSRRCSKSERTGWIWEIGKRDIWFTNQNCQIHSNSLKWSHWANWSLSQPWETVWKTSQVWETLTPHSTVSRSRQNGEALNRRTRIKSQKKNCHTYLMISWHFKRKQTSNNCIAWSLAWLYKRYLIPSRQREWNSMKNLALLAVFTMASITSSSMLALSEPESTSTEMEKRILTWVWRETENKYYM